MSSTNPNAQEPFADQANVSTIREVFNYIKQYRNKLFILKIEDALLSSPLFPMLMKDVIQLHDIGTRIIIVTGTRTTIDRNLEQAGFETRFMDGVRITRTQFMPHVKLAAMEVAESVISHLAAGGANGIMGNWIRARSLGVVDGVDFQWTGQVESIRSDILLKLLDQQFIPVMVNLGFNSTGKCYNVNSNHIARQLCLNLAVEKLFFIGEDEGVPADGLTLPRDVQIHANGNLSNLDLAQVTMILKDNPDKLPHRDRDYLENALKISTGQGRVNRVYIISGNTEGSLLREVFSSVGGGTMIHSNKYARIREALPEDIPAILQLMEDYMKAGNLVVRTTEDILERLDDYHIYEVDQVVYGCGALHILDRDWGELGAIAVNPSYKSQGVGRSLIRHLISDARARGLKQLFLLTTQAADWFYEFGFTPGEPKDLPESRRAVYNARRNSRVLTLAL
ncbi:MAG: amino-acid N-acetyltransferase [Pseudomonadota bacterium]